MANKKISQLTDGTSFQAGDEAVVNRGGTNYKVDPTQFGSSIDVTGTVTADGLTVDAAFSSINYPTVGGIGPTLRLENTSNTADAGNGARLEFVSGDNPNRNAYIETRSAGTFGRNPSIVFGSEGDGGGDVDHVLIADNGDISFYEDTGTTPKFFWDASAEALGIGTNSPAAKLDVSSAGNLIISNKSDPGVNSQSLPGYLELRGLGWNTSTGTETIGGRIALSGVYASGQVRPSLVFSLQATNTSMTEAMRIDSSGNVGIGTSSPGNTFVVGGTNPQIQLLGSGTSSDLRINAAYGGSAVGAIVTVGAHPLAFFTNNAERARIDSSGNLLVGQSSTVNPASDNVEGISIQPVGQINASVDGGISANFNRITSDGDIVRFRKDGTTVGSIGANGGRITIGHDDAGLKFNGQFDTIHPFNMTTNSNSDAVVSLGTGSQRFKDLYLSGGVYLGGTGAANLLDDYEAGTFTPTATGATTAGTATYTTQFGEYTKIGDRVFYHLRVAWTGHTGTGDLLISGLPFTSNSTASNHNQASVMAIGLTFSNALAAYILNNTTSITITSFASSAALTNVSMDAAATLIISGHYTV